MTKSVYWLNPDFERRCFYKNFHPYSSTTLTSSTKSVEAHFVGDGRRKRRRVSRYVPNEREQEANDQHSLIHSLLEDAFNTFQQWKASIPSLMSTSSRWIEPHDANEIDNDVNLEIETSVAPLVSSPWIMLHKMKGIVKPKFQISNEVESARDLFGKINSNDCDEEVICVAHDQRVLIPPRSSFLMSDLSQLGPLCNDLTKDGLFDLVLVDIPWENKSVRRGRKYETIPNQQLKRIPFSSFLKQDLSIVCFWLTNRTKLIKYFYNELLPSWNLKPVTTWYWLKVDASGDLVSSLQSNHRRPYEKLVITTRRDDACFDLLQIPKDLVLISPRQEHSRKPLIGPFIKSTLWPLDHSKHCLEMFARELIPHWISWGNEVLHFQNLEQFKHKSKPTIV